MSRKPGARTILPAMVAVTWLGASFKLAIEAADWPEPVKVGSAAVSVPSIPGRCRVLTLEAR